MIRAGTRRPGRAGCPAGSPPTRHSPARRRSIASRSGPRPRTSSPRAWAESSKRSRVWRLARSSGSLSTWAACSRSTSVAASSRRSPPFSALTLQTTWRPSAARARGRTVQRASGWTPTPPVSAHERSRLRRVRRRLGAHLVRAPDPRPPHLECRGRRGPGADRTQRLGKDDSAPPGERAHPSDGRRRAGRGPRHHRLGCDLAPAPHRLCHPGDRPDAAPHRRRERRDRGGARGMGRRAARVTELLDLVGLPAPQYGARYPHELSGGQRQRVGVARALAVDPPLMLLDEPFGALDPITRRELQDGFRALQRQLRKTAIFVTHDLHEAARVADRWALLADGRLLAAGTPAELEASTDAAVRAFLAAGRDA